MQKKIQNKFKKRKTLISISFVEFTVHNNWTTEMNEWRWKESTNKQTNIQTHQQNICLLYILLHCNLVNAINVQVYNRKTIGLCFCFVFSRIRRFQWSGILIFIGAIWQWIFRIVYILFLSFVCPINIYYEKTNLLEIERNKFNGRSKFIAPFEINKQLQIFNLVPNHIWNNANFSYIHTHTHSTNLKEA